LAGHYQSGSQETAVVAVEKQAPGAEEAVAVVSSPSPELVAEVAAVMAAM
jgi:hypothetical protein